MFSESTLNLIIIIIGGLGTLAIYSYLWRENPVYRFIEHIFIGIAAGFGIIETIKNFLWPKVLSPLLGFDVIVYPDGTVAQAYEPAYALYLLPMMFGLLYYTIYSKRFSWLSKVVIAFSLGASGGMAFEGFFNRIIPQVVSTFKPLLVFDELKKLDWGQSLSNLVFVLTFLLVMNYFFFSFKQEGKAARFVNRSGRWVMMICFGAFFGSTVMARMALLVERVDFLLGDWLTALGQIFLIGSGAV